MEDLSKLSKAELIERLNAQQVTVEPDSEFHKLERIANRSNANSMPFRETTDHPGVFLWTEKNRRIGPFHPDNAKDIMRRWSLKGFKLYVTKRSDADVEAYINSPLGKKRALENEQKNRIRASRSTKTQAERFAKEIAKETAAAVAGVMK
jgi:hypothetical protein